MRRDYEIDEETFDKIMDKFESELFKYIKDTFLYDYIAFYIAKGIELDALWEGNFSGKVNAAMDTLCSLELEREDYKILKKIKIIFKFGAVVVV